MPLLFEQVGGDSGVHSATESDDDTLFGHKHIGCCAIIPAMELRQLRYFVRVVEIGSISRAALDLNLVQSALSQQITRLESELSTRLLQRSAQGVSPTEAGMAFFREAQLTLRHADQAVRAAQHARLTGSVSVGLAPTTAAVLGLPLMRAMRERYPDVRLHMVESLSGHLAHMLNARQLDLAVLFDSPLQASHSLQSARRWSVMPLLEESLFLISSRTATAQTDARRKRLDTLALTRLKDHPLILPTGPHGLRSTLDAAFARAKIAPTVVLEIDSLPMLMEAVDAGLGATLQPWAAVSRFADASERFSMVRISDADVKRRNVLCSLSDDELSPAGLATRVVLADCARSLVSQGHWGGATLTHHDS
jgi:LysR family transcriptional regulator, regulatory protein for tcuABC